MGMINLSQETEALAQRLAAAQRLSVEAAIQRALEAHARASGIAPQARASARRVPRSRRRAYARVSTRCAEDRRRADQRSATRQ